MESERMSKTSNRIFNFQFKGNSLVLTLIIFLVLSTLCVSLILTGFYNKQLEKTNVINTRLNYNLGSAINLVLADTTQFQQTDTDSLDLFGDEKDSVAIVRKSWGFFQLAELSSHFKRFEKTKIFFYGSVLPKQLNASLYLADHNRPLSISGNTRLNGNVFLPKSGKIVSDIVANTSGSATQATGEIKISEDSLPAIAFQLSEIKHILDKNFKVQIEDMAISMDSLRRSFNDDRLMIRLHGRVLLENCKLSGQILICSDSIIEVGKTAHLDNIIMIAPVIKFEKGFSGRLQAFASDSLIVDENCEFTYPSNIVLLKKEKNGLQNKMIIGNNCVISGAVLSICQEKDHFKSYIQIGTGTTIHGLLYTMGYLDLSGRIKGIVLTDYFIYKSPTTVYENYLVNAEIDRSQLSPYFVFPSLFNNDSPKAVVAWVN